MKFFEQSDEVPMSRSPLTLGLRSIAWSVATFAPAKLLIGYPLAWIRRSPRFGAAAKAVATMWARVVDAFCPWIEPLLRRYFPDHCLIITLDRLGAPVMHHIVRGAGGLDIAVEADRAALTSVKWTAVEVRLPPEMFLQRTLFLPIESREFLSSIIEHRLDRLTPWAARRVLYGYRIVGSGKTNPLEIAFLATSADLVASPISDLADLGLKPTAIGASTVALTKPLDIYIQPGGSTMVRARSRTVVSRIALAGFTACAVLALSTEYIALSMDGLRDETVVRLSKARRVLRTRSADVAGGPETAMLNAKRPDRAIMVLVDRLASALPTDTFLRDLAISPSKVKLVGSSSGAPKLVSALEGAGLYDVHFVAAITREKTGRDNFEITADWRPSEVPTP